MKEKEDTYVLMSMKDSNSKDLANAISNDTSRKIISYIAEKGESTETQIAKDLKLPLTTIHYNIKLLQKSKLIESKEFYWSKKGKEMLVYKLAKKFIIIAPSNSEGTLAKLKSLLPITLISFIGSGIIYLLQKGTTITQNIQTFITPIDKTEGVFGIEEAGRAGDVGIDPTGAVNDSIVKITETIVHEPNYALIFLLSALFIILLVFLLDLRKRR